VHFQRLRRRGQQWFAICHWISGLVAGHCKEGLVVGVVVCVVVGVVVGVVAGVVAGVVIGVVIGEVGGVDSELYINHWP